MKKTIDICIGNYGYRNEGELHDARVSLPVTDLELHAFLVAHRLWDRQHEETYISDYDGVPFGLKGLFTECTSIDDLNMLARQMQEKPDECQIFNEYLACGGDAPSTVIELMSMIEQAGVLEFYYYKSEGGTPEERIARDVLSANGELAVLEEMRLDRFFDFERYGRLLGYDYSLGENGYVTDGTFTPDLYSRDELAAMYGGSAVPAPAA